MPDVENTQDTAQTPDPPWYGKYQVPEEDHALLGRYKDEAEAIASIGQRERYLSGTLKLPDAKTPEARAKQVREALGRLGAYESPDKYAEDMRAAIGEELKDVVTDEEIEKVAAKAHKHGILPEVFRESLKERVAQLTAGARAEREAVAQANQRQVDDDKVLSDLWGRDKAEKLKDADAFAKHMDTVFATLNRARFSEEEIANGGGLFYRMLHRDTSPENAILFAEMQRRFVGGTDGPGGGGSPGGSSEWQKHYEAFKRDCGVLGEEKARAYADKMAGGNRS